MTKGLPGSVVFRALLIGKAGSGVWWGEGGREKMFSLKIWINSFWVYPSPLSSEMTPRRLPSALICLTQERKCGICDRIKPPIIKDTHTGHCPMTFTWITALCVTVFTLFAAARLTPAFLSVLGDDIIPLRGLVCGLTFKWSATTDSFRRM